MSETLNLFDIAFFSLTILFAFLGFFRGIVKELAGLLVWVSAIAASYYLTPYLVDALSGYSDSKMLIYAGSKIIVFVLTFFIVSMSIAGFVKDLRKSVPGSFDKTFGFLFGVGKSVFIFALIYSAAMNIVSNNKTPKFLAEAKTATILIIPAEQVEPFVKSCVKAVSDNFYGTSKKKNDLDDKIEEIIEEKEVTTQDEESEGDKVFDYGYSKKDIEKMNRLIDIVD